MSASLSTLTSTTFDEEVVGSPVPVIVDVWAEWCGPCKLIEPSLEWIAETYAGRVRVFAINGDDNPEVVARFGVMSLPTLLVFDDGMLVNRIVGAMPTRRLVEELGDVLDRTPVPPLGA